MIILKKQKEKEITLADVLRTRARCKSVLGSLAIEGNSFAVKHLDAIQGMDIFDQYFYLKRVFDDLGCKYQK